MSKQLKITGSNATQVITIDDGDGGMVSFYGASAAYVAAQVMMAAAIVGTGSDYPVMNNPVTFNKGN